MTSLNRFAVGVLVVAAAALGGQWASRATYTPKGIAGQTIATSESTNSTSYTNLTTSGPAVTVTTGTSALVMLSGVSSKTTSGNSGFISVAVSGATTLAASDANSTQQASAIGTGTNALARALVLTGLTPGANTFTVQYRVDGGTFSFQNRSIVVVP